MLFVRSRKFRIAVAAAGALICALLWWPRIVTGTVINFESGKPIVGVCVKARASTLKAFWPLLLFGDYTYSTVIFATTDNEGRFTATYLSGYRLRNISYELEKWNFEMRTSDRGDYHQDDTELGNNPVLPLWEFDEKEDLSDADLVQQRSRESTLKHQASGPKPCRAGRARSRA